MMPYEQDLYCYRGETFSQNVLFKQNGKPLDLTGCTVNAQVRPELNGKKLSADMLCIVNASSGKISMNLTSKQTSELTPGTYRYDLKVMRGSEVHYYLCGSFIVEGRVTE